MIARYKTRVLAKTKREELSIWERTLLIYTREGQLWKDLEDKSKDQRIKGDPDSHNQ